MPENPVVKNYAYCLIHAPDLVRYGSKPRREIAKGNKKNKGIKNLIHRHSRSYHDAVMYPPNQVFVGNLSPEELKNIPQPWYKDLSDEYVHLNSVGPFGCILDQELFYLFLKLADVLNPPLFEVRNELALKWINSIKQAVEIYPK